MKIKIGHTADWHLGTNKYGIDRYEEQERAIDFMIEEFKKNEVKLILHCGDLSDYRTPPNSELNNRINLLLSKMAKVAKVIVVKGNHDWPGYSAINPFSPFINLNFYDRVSIYEDEYFKIFIVPYYDIRKLLKEQELDISNMSENAKIAFKNYFNSIQNQISPNKINIFAGHILLEGMLRVDENFDAEAMIPPNFIPSSIDYAALGHIHAQQKINSACRNIWYSGSIIKTDFGHEKSIHGFIISEFDTSSKEVSVKCIKTPIIEFKTLEYNMKDKSSEEIKKIILGDLEENYYYRIKIISDKFLPYLESEIKNISKNILKVNFINNNVEKKEEFKIDISKLSLVDIYEIFINNDSKKSEFINKYKEYKKKLDEKKENI